LVLQPNGADISPDDNTLYVTDPDALIGQQRVSVYAVNLNNDTALPI